jgi:hypothetical protein
MSTAERADEPEPNLESYDTDDGTVIYDSANPLAWIKAAEDATRSLNETV